MGSAQWGGTDGALSISDDQNNVIFTLPNADFGDSTYAVIKNNHNAGVIVNDFEWSVSPNPAQTQLNVSWPSNEWLVLDVLDMLGKKVLDTKQGNNVVEFNVSNLGSGAYMLRVQRPNGTIIQQKFVKN
jgi:hypothetical protein